MDLTNSLNVVFGNLPRDSPHEESLFTPPPDDPASPEKQFWVSVPPLPAGLTRDSYRTCPRSLKRARSKNAEKREYAKYDDETDQTTLSVGWLDEQLTELHTVQAVNLALRGFIVDMGAPNSSNHAFHGFPIPNHTQFNDMGDVKTCAMSGWDGLPSPRQPGPATKINRRKQKPVYTVFDSDTENRRSTSRTKRPKKRDSDPQPTFAASLTDAYNQAGPSNPRKRKRSIEKASPEEEYQYALGEYIPFIDDPKHDDDFVPTATKKRPKTTRDSSIFNGNDHDGDHISKGGQPLRIKDEEHTPIPSPKPKPKNVTPPRPTDTNRPPELNQKPLQRVLPTPTPEVPLKIGPPTKQVPRPPLSSASTSASRSASAFASVSGALPIGPPPKRKTKVPPPAANIARPRLNNPARAVLPSPASHHSSNQAVYHSHSHSPSQSQSQSAVQSVSPAIDPSTGPLSQEHHYPNYGNHFAKPLSRFGSGERQKRRGLYVSHSASPWSSTGSLGTAVAAGSSSSSSIRSVTPPIPYSSYSSLVNEGGVAANGALIVRKLQDQDEGTTTSVHQPNWWSWTPPVGSPSRPQQQQPEPQDGGGDVEMQDLDSQLGVNDEGVFGNGTIDPSVFAPPAISSFSPVSSLSDEEDEEEEKIDQLDEEEDVDAEGETDPDVVQSPEPEPQPEPEPLPSKRTRKPPRRYGEESTSSLSWEDSQADETTTANTTEVDAGADVDQDQEQDPQPNPQPTQVHNQDMDPLTPGTPSGPYPRIDVLSLDKNKTWPEAEDATYCHCCRRRVQRAKMFCANPGCNKSFCVRCLAIRFPYLEFDAERKDWECLLCANICTCDICCKRRREVFYPIRNGSLVDPGAEGKGLGSRGGGGGGGGGAGGISTRGVKKPSAKAQLLAEEEDEDFSFPSSSSKSKRTAKAAPVVPVVPQEPLVFRDIEEPTQHWGLIYHSTNGRRIGEAFMGVDGRDDVVLGKWDFPSPKPPPIRVTLDPLWVTARQSKKRRRKKKRVFVGKIQDEIWGECVGLREHPEDDDDILQEDEDGEVKKDVVGYRRPGTISQVGKVVKWYVGRKEPLFWRRPVPEDAVDDVDGEGELEEVGEPLPTEENHHPLPPKMEEVVPAMSCLVSMDTDSPLTVLDSSSGEGEYCARSGGEGSDVYIKSPATKKRNEGEHEPETYSGSLDHNAILTAIVLGLKEVGVDPIYSDM